MDFDRTLNMAFIGNMQWIGTGSLMPTPITPDGWVDRPGDEWVDRPGDEWRDE